MMTRLAIARIATTLAMTCAATTGCLDASDTPPEVIASNAASPGFRGEPCTREVGCSAGLACQGGFCQATCSEAVTCEMYPDTHCIAPVLTRMTERFCLKAGDYRCNQALDSDAFCAQSASSTPVCLGDMCVVQLDANNTPGACTQDEECEDATTYCEVSTQTCQPGCRENSCGESARCDLTARACEDVCVDDSECDAMSEACLPDGTAGSFCTAVDSCAESETPDVWCQRREGTLRTRCEANACVPITRSKYAIQIVDLSTGIACQEPRGNLSDSGADIVAVELFDVQGEALGFGKVERFVQGSGANDFISTAHLNGQMPDIDNQGCPNPVGGQRFRTDSVTALGCNGYMIMSFPDMNLERTPLLPGFTVTISEYDVAVCGDNGGISRGAEVYEVYLCEDLNEDGEFVNAECDVLISDEPVEGYSFHTIPGM